jgi:hypothetical protein
VLWRTGGTDYETAGFGWTGELAYPIVGNRAVRLGFLVFFWALWAGFGSSPSRRVMPIPARVLLAYLRHD